MKQTLFLSIAIMFLSGITGGVALAEDMGTAFTYQGELNDAGSPANGVYDFEFKLYDALTAGTQIGSTTTSEDVDVSNGHFSILLDFGTDVFTGEARYLEIGVRPGASTGSFSNIDSRQRINPSPYSIRASVATQAMALGGIKQKTGQKTSHWTTQNGVTDAEMTVTTENCDALIIAYTGFFQPAVDDCRFELLLDGSVIRHTEGRVGTMWQHGLYLIWFGHLDSGTHTIQLIAIGNSYLHYGIEDDSGRQIIFIQM